MRILLALFTCLALISCAVGPNFRSPPPPIVPGYTEKPMPSKTVSTKTSGGASQHFEWAQDIPADWWTLFHSPALDVLIRCGISNSPNLAAAQAALREAQQNLLAEIGAGLFPSVDANLSAQRQQFAGSNFGGAGSSIFNVYNASVTAAYTLDVFGGIRRQIETFAALVDYEQYQLQAAYLTLTSNIVTTAVTEASLREQIKATNELINAQQKVANILQKQFDVGAVSRTDVLTQQTEVAQTTATLPPLEKNLSETRNALAVLVGAIPSQISVPEFNLDQLNLPTHLPVSIPSNLVRQRPDVLAQEALLHQASAQIGVATANMLPQFTITGDLGFTNGGQKIWSMLGEIAQPIFQGGSLLAQRRASIANFQEMAADYRQTVLTAFQDVADALRAIEIDARALQAQTVAEKTSYETLKIAKIQYTLGGANYLNILAAQRQYQTARIDRIKAQAARYADTAALFQALGGGWWNQGRVRRMCSNFVTIYCN